MTMHFQAHQVLPSTSLDLTCRAKPGCPAAAHRLTLRWADPLHRYSLVLPKCQVQAV